MVTAFVEDGSLDWGDVIAAPGLGTASGFWIFLFYVTWMAATGDFVGQGRNGFDYLGFLTNARRGLMRSKTQWGFYRELD